MRLVLPWPHKLLWPNGSRGHPRAVAAEKRKHKQWAAVAAMEQRAKFRAGDGTVPIRLVIRAKPFGPLPDRDNCVAAAKAYLDGISATIGVNDQNFAAPTVEFDSTRSGQMIVEVGL